MPETAQVGEHLQALGAMGCTCFAHPEDLFEHGLRLLVQQLGVDRATVASMTDSGLECLWCAGGEGEGDAAFQHDPNLSFCPEALLDPGAALAIADAETDPDWAGHSGWSTLGIRAYAGVALHYSGYAMGVLSVQSARARAWDPAELDLLKVMAALFGKAMEVEALKAELAQAREVMDLNAAVMEDHALESPRTGLPTRRYLEVWCRTSLMLARRRREIIALASWVQPPETGRDELLARLAGTLRGVDLLVDLGRDRFLLVLPRTLKAGADIVLERLRQRLGIKCIGATLWNPLLSPDRETATLEPAIRRTQGAAAGRLEQQAGGADDGEIVWTFLEPSREHLMDGPSEW